MRWGTIGIALCAMLMATSFSVGNPPSAHAQAADRDAEAREYFERGRVAFEGADYERALVYFRHAYRLSSRAELQYNIGVAADRLQREDEALEAFESYLANTTSPARAAEVNERIEALRESIEERDATERALVDATVESRAITTPSSDRTGLPVSTIVGGAALGAVGVAGVSAMVVGLVKNGSCADEVSGACVTERSRTPWTYVYGALGVAALAGSATWFGVSHRRTKNAERDLVWTFTPAGVLVSGKF
ncbi:MAG: tetratricopeptide repeat protein [Polyangiales bacterium]